VDCGLFYILYSSVHDVRPSVAGKRQMNVIISGGRLSGCLFEVQDERMILKSKYVRLRMNMNDCTVQ
jgi:hypothetical protein